MDYKEIFEKARKDLEELKLKGAKIDEQIRALAEKLNLDTTKPLEPQVESLKKSLEEQIAGSEAKLSELQEKLKDYE